MWTALIGVPWHRLVLMASLIETIFIRLCRIHKSPKKRREGSVSRWTLMLDSHSNIWALIHINGGITQDTELQLINVNCYHTCAITVFFMLR